MSLYDAARSGTLNTLTLLLSKDADVNAKGGEYGTPLQVAAFSQNYDAVKLLLARGADVNADEGFLGTALHIAAYNGSLDIVRLLLDHNADVNGQSNTMFRTALQAAAYQGREEVVRLLLSHGADINIQGGVHGSALKAATYPNRQSIVQLLLANGADVNQRGGLFGYALQAAVYGGSVDLVKLLLSSGAHTNAQGGKLGTSLQAAAYQGSLPVIMLLLEHGADVNIEGGKFGSALQAAAYRGNTQIVELLLEKGANINIQGGQYGNALQAAVYRGSPELVRLLLHKGADVNAQGGEHGSALQVAIYMKRKDIVGLLLEEGAKFDKPTNANGSSLLHLAVAAQDHSILKLLIDAGAAAQTTEVDAFGQTPIHLAAMTDDMEALRILSNSSMKIDINIGDIDGCTALHRAVENSAFRVAEWLLERGARTAAEDYSMATPFQRAAKMRNLKMMSLLFPHTTGGLVKASEWRSCLPQGQCRNIILSRFESGLQSVEIMDGKELTAYLETKSYPLDFFKTKISASSDGECIATVPPEKMIILLEDDSFLKTSSPAGVYWRWWRKMMDKSGTGFHSIHEGWSWKIQMSKIPAAVALRQPPPEECFLECRVLLPAYKVLPPPDHLSPLAASPMRHAMIWIMTKPNQQYPHSQHVLKSKVFFTTFEYAEIPDSPIKLFVPCIQQLEDEWNRICDAAERHLSKMRTSTFHANGRNNNLVKIHLSDAEMWTKFNETHLAQMRYLRSLTESYDRWPVLQEGAISWLSWKRENLQSEIENAEARVRERIARLTSTSQELIQLVEFNLTSIAEAQKSTSANRSLKRLSWITFIFLPLMFISSLFGMNVDILESNPSWWLYLPFAGGMILLTMAIWIVFKRDSHLEDRIERRFDFIFRPQATHDEESLLPTGNDWKEKSYEFPANGKKRS
ncbi:ankyrin repeat-containing domain protein [Aspergillus lucknowensis]|uniref:Ankyrin repeat-containing domain protein n=1 Tax=Aspergillus lucknowensis TaxID=176173 RepID=A0ABR4M370_9EURO